MTIFPLIQSNWKQRSKRPKKKKLHSSANLYFGTVNTTWAVSCLLSRYLCHLKNGPHALSNDDGKLRRFVVTATTHWKTVSERVGERRSQRQLVWRREQIKWTARCTQCAMETAKRWVEESIWLVAMTMATTTTATKTRIILIYYSSY